MALGEVFASHAAVAMQSARSNTEVVAPQRSMLPELLPEVAGVSMAARYHPASIGSNVGGDWYDAYRLPDGRLVVTLGDVAGHGLAAASVMGQIRNALRAYTVEDPAPAQAVGLVSKLLSFVEPTTMTAGQIILLYSDGLVERRGEAIDVGLQRLADAAATAPRDLELFCDHIIGELVSSSHHDDIAVLALRVDRA